MAVFKFILMSIILVSFIVSRSSFNKKVKEKKELSNLKRGTLEPHRSLSSEEAEGLNAYYGIDSRPGGYVYRIKGDHSMAVVKQNAAVFRTNHWIGGIEVKFYEGWEIYLQDQNVAEVVFSDVKQKGMAYILNLNDAMDVRQLIGIKERIENGAPGKFAAADIDILGSRRMTPEEAQYLSMDIRFFAWLLITVGMWCAFFNADQTVWLLGAAGLAVLGIVLYFFKKTPPLKKVTCFSGRLVEKVTALCQGEDIRVNKQLYVGRVAVDVPDHWKSYLSLDRDYKVEGLLAVNHEKKLAAELISVGDGLRLDTECKRFDYTSMGRYATGGVFISISLFFLWFLSGRPYARIQAAWRALGSPDVAGPSAHIVQGAILNICIALVIVLVIRILMILKFNGDRLQLMKQFYQKNAFKAGK